MTDATTEKLSRYRALVLPMAAQALRAAARTVPLSNSVTLGVAPAMLLLRDDPSLYREVARGLHALAHEVEPMLTDPSGHRRDVYHPFVLHLHLRAFSRRYESMPANLWMACEDVLPACIETVRGVEEFADHPPVAEATAVVLWRALCLAEFADITRRDVDIEVADAIVHQAVSRPGKNGSLHPPSPDESPEAWTYRELCGMHALANVALLRRNRTWARRVEEIGNYHLEHTQPDYTTTQPWGVFAGLWSDQSALFAQQLLHDVASSQATASGENNQDAAMIGMLLADAADALSNFDTTP